MEGGANQLGVSRAGRLSLLWPSGAIFLLAILFPHLFSSCFCLKKKKRIKNNQRKEKKQTLEI